MVVLKDFSEDHASVHNILNKQDLVEEYIGIMALAKCLVHQ